MARVAAQRGQQLGILGALAGGDEGHLVNWDQTITAARGDFGAL